METWLQSPRCSGRNRAWSAPTCHCSGSPSSSPLARPRRNPAPDSPHRRARSPAATSAASNRHCTSSGPTITTAATATAPHPAGASEPARADQRPRPARPQPRRRARQRRRLPAATSPRAAQLPRRSSSRSPRDITGELWPDLDDRGHNLRVTLGYLQRVLQPDRASNDPPYFLRSNGPWLSLEGRDHLVVDPGRSTICSTTPTEPTRRHPSCRSRRVPCRVTALARRTVRGSAVLGLGASGPRTVAQPGYTNAAVRGGELLLAAGAPGGARAAARRAIDADPTAESRLSAPRPHPHTRRTTGPVAPTPSTPAATRLADARPRPDSTTIAILS